jgi:hypothetical protein
LYRFVDQPLDRQDHGTRFLVWALRQWVAAAVDGRCACHTLCVAFAGIGIADAVDDFHIAMSTLCNNARIALRFGAIDRPQISEHEAILVALTLSAAQRGEADVKAVAGQLVHPDMALLLARSLAGVARRMDRAGLVPGPAGPRPA